MDHLVSFYKSTVGKKVLVALSGIVLFGFVVGHMVGNFKAFMGVDPDSGVHKLDIYAHFLRVMGSDLVGKTTVLWLVRAGLLGAVALHVVMVLQLRAINNRSKGDGYRHPYQFSSKLPARMMALSGAFLAIFIVYHLLHLTFGITFIGEFKEGAVYQNVYVAFSKIWVVAVYVLAVGCLGLHLFHGAWSLFQTLGLDNPDRNALLRAFARVMAVVLFLGFAAVPIAFGFGAMPKPPTVYLDH